MFTISLAVTKSPVCTSAVLCPRDVSNNRPRGGDGDSIVSRILTFCSIKHIRCRAKRLLAAAPVRTPSRQPRACNSRPPFFSPPTFIDQTSAASVSIHNHNDSDSASDQDIRLRPLANSVLGHTISLLIACVCINQGPDFQKNLRTNLGKT